MRIRVEIPIEFDGPLTAEERGRFREYMEAAAEPLIRAFAQEQFGPGARMFETVCRFAFKEAEVTVE